MLDTLALIFAMVLVNLTGGHIFARVQKLIVLLALVSLLGAGIVGFVCAILGFHGATLTHFSLDLPHGIGGVLETVSLAFLALSGFDIVATTGEEVKSPQRILPLAILCTLGIVLLLYLLVTAATAGVLSGPHLGTKTPLADAAGQLFGLPGQELISVTAILTTAATGNALLAATSRITFAMARDGLLPRFLGHLHPSTRVPWVAVIINGLVFTCLALTDSIQLLAAVGSFLYILQFTIPLVGLILVRTRSAPSPSFRTPAPYLILPLACGGCCLLLYASGQQGMGAGLIWLGAGFFLYLSVQGLKTYIQRRRYLNRGYGAITEAIELLRERISHMLADPQESGEDLCAAQLRIEELKRLRTLQARSEELEQRRSSQARIEELKHLRAIQARAEELEFLQATQARVEELNLQRATQVSIAELNFLQTTRVQPARGGGMTVLENSLARIDKVLHEESS